MYFRGSGGGYWSSSITGEEYAHSLYFYGCEVYTDVYFRSIGRSVRLAVDE